MYRAILTPKQDKPPCLNNCIAVQGRRCADLDKIDDMKTECEQYDRCDEFECNTCPEADNCSGMEI